MSESYELEKYGPDWLVYRPGECVPVATFATKREATRWVARAPKRECAECGEWTECQTVAHRVGNLAYCSTCANEWHDVEHADGCANNPS